MQKDKPYSHTKGLFRCSGILDSSRPHLTNGDCRGNISLSLSHGEKVNTPRGGWLPFLLCHTATTHPPRQMCLTPVTEWSHSGSDAHTRRAIKPLHPTFIISKMECWVSDLLLPFNLLDYFPLAGVVLGFQSVFYACLFKAKQLIHWRKSNWNC